MTLAFLVLVVLELKLWCLNQRLVLVDKLMSVDLVEPASLDFVEQTIVDLLADSRGVKYNE